MSIAQLQVPSQAKRGEIIDIRVAIQHPMETGFRRNNLGQAWVDDAGEKGSASAVIRVAA